MQSAPGPSRVSHIAALDGLRGIAILSVMLFHATLSWPGGPRPSGGFLGVDIFFVLSGFLITNLLLKEWQHSGSMALRAFYARRALRLLPALFALMATILLLPGVFYSAERPWRDALIAAAYATNWVRAFGGDIRFFAHTWSLTIEEQFYVIWPLLLLALLKLRVRRREILFLVVLGIAVPAVLRVALWHGPMSVKRLYYGFDTRFDSLLLGCLVALIASWDLIPRNRRSLIIIRLAATASAVVLAVLIASATEESQLTYFGLGAVACTSVAVLLVHVLYCPSRLSELMLGNRPLVWVGRISYGLYLWHDPIFFGMLNPTRMAKIGVSGFPLLGVRFAAAFVAATVSFYLIERPFLRIKERLASRGDGVAGRPGLVEAVRSRPSVPVA
jgi:peptidoglycan/LPS O-acetylase OafA/YrhL